MSSWGKHSTLHCDGVQCQAKMSFIFLPYWTNRRGKYLDMSKHYCTAFQFFPRQPFLQMDQCFFLLHLLDTWVDLSKSVGPHDSLAIFFPLKSGVDFSSCLLLLYKVYIVSFSFSSSSCYLWLATHTSHVASVHLSSETWNKREEEWGKIFLEIDQW